MIDKKLIQQLQKAYTSHQQTRHEVIEQSNKILREAKQVIFSLHRHDKEAAKKQLDDAKKAIQKLQRGLLKKKPQLNQQGAYLAALEEYVEADLFYQAMYKKSISPITGIDVPEDQYIGGLCDMTGELTRQAVLRATDRDYQTVDRYHEIAQEVVGQLIQFDLVGQLRQKYDDAKRNLKRMEGVRYDISLRD